MIGHTTYAYESAAAGATKANHQEERVHTPNATPTKARAKPSHIKRRIEAVSLRRGKGLSGGTGTFKNLHKGSQPWRTS